MSKAHRSGWIEFGMSDLMVRLLLAAILVLGSQYACAQAAELPAAPTRPSNPATQVPEKDWPAMQKEQAWATEKLEKSPRHGEWVNIKSGERMIHAWVVHPETKGKTMVVIVLHEANGLMASERLTADEIAAMGYTTIAPDMVSGQGPNNGDVESFTPAAPVSQTLSHLSDAAVNADINAVADYAAGLPASNGKFAIVGLSWGGGAAFRYVTSQHRPDLQGIFVFYDVGPPRETQKIASASTPIPVDAITVPVYGFYPTLDKRTMLALQPTEDAMAAAGKFFEPVVYPDADHGYMRVAEDPLNNNPADVQAFNDSLHRLKVNLAHLNRARGEGGMS